MKTTNVYPKSEKNQTFNFLSLHFYMKKKNLKVYPDGGGGGGDGLSFSVRISSNCR